MNYDVIVVGAGAAGGAAALELARRGLKVLLLERHRFPRYKPCAGGITRKTWNVLKLDIRPLLRFHAREISLSYRITNERTLPAREVFTLMVVRTELDALVVAEAVRHGAQFADGVPVEDIDAGGPTVAIKIGREWLRARYVIAADGAGSVISSKLKLRPQSPSAFAVEANLTVEPARLDDALDRPVMTFDFGSVRKGYGWVFPKGDHLCVGLYTVEGKIAGARAALLQYIREKGITARAEEEVKGHLIPLGGHHYRQRDLPVLLAGDAAGFADALTGEGIYYAMLSGQLAAETVAEALSRPRAGTLDYNRRLAEHLLPELALSARLARLFYDTLPASFHLLKRRPVATIFLEAAVAGASYRDTILHAPTYLLRAMDHDSLRRWRSPDAPES